MDCVSAGNCSISQRNFPVPPRKKRSSSRKLPPEEIERIQTNKRYGYSDREIAKIANRSLGVVGKYTRGIKLDPLIVAQQPTPPTQHVDGTAAYTPEETKASLALLNKVRRLEAYYQFSQSPEGRLILRNLKKIKEIIATLDTLGPTFGNPASQSLRDWTRGFQKQTETALQHFRQGTHRSRDSLEQCVACTYALTRFPSLA